MSTYFYFDFSPCLIFLLDLAQIFPYCSSKLVTDIHKMILALNTFGLAPGSPAVLSLEPLRDLSHLFICCRIYLNDGGSLLTCPFILSPRETHGWMDASLPQTAASCHLTGGVWASLPISPFRNSIICVCALSGRNDWFPCRKPM